MSGLPVNRLWLAAMLASSVAFADQEEPKPDQPSPQPAPKPPADEDEEPDAGEGAGAFPGMTTILDEAVLKLAQKRNEEALERLKRKDYPGALALLKQANDLSPKDAEIVNNLGYIYYLLGNAEDAEKHLREAIALDADRHVAYINLADLLGREGESPKRLHEAAELLKKARELHGNRANIILRQARVARLQGAAEDAERFYQEYTSVRKPSNKVLVEIGDYLRELGRDEDAFAWYQKVEDTEEWGKVAASRIWEMEVERQARKYGWTGKTEETPEKARALTDRATKLLRKSKLSEAKRLLEKALAIAPGYTDARGIYGDVLRRQGDGDGAELAYLRALSLDNGNAEIYARLGELYLETDDRSRSVEAVLHLRRAIELRPDWAALHLTLARALQRTGEMELALTHLDIFLADEPKGKRRKQARRLKRTIEKLWEGTKEHRGSAVPKGHAEKQQTLSKELVNVLTRARSHLAAGRLDAAMAELRRLPSGRQGPVVLNLEARILHASGRLKEAAEVLASSLRIDPEQVEVREQLGVMMLDMGFPGPARAQFHKAEKLGSVEAKYHLARMETRSQEPSTVRWFYDLLRMKLLLNARDQLDDYLAQGAGLVYIDEARTLRVAIDNRIWTSFGVVFGFGLFLVALIGLLTRRTWGGVDLSALVARHPESGPEVQRVLSAIRHEVLKHNTLALGGVVESIERGGVDAAEKAKRFQQSLEGEGEGESVKDRLDKYTLELKKIGRSYGVRLNLRRKEPAISLLYQGFGLIEAASTALVRLPTLGAKAKRRLLQMLKKAFRFLNVDGYEAVQQMLGKIRLLEVDESLLRGIFVRVSREPAFARVSMAPLDIVTDLPLPIEVLVSRGAFEDIFGNLVRNAIQSSMGNGDLPVEIGFHVELEVDEVTGFERAVFLVNDSSDKELTTEMIRGQAIEGGLGLTMDLVSRYDGSVDVVPGRHGWRKAVRVKLPIS